MRKEWIAELSGINFLFVVLFLSRAAQEAAAAQSDGNSVT